jgi:hypothetical protein
MKRYILCSILVANSLFAVDFANVLKQGTEMISNTTKENPDISKALKEALNMGIESAMTSLGKENGFLKNPDVKIEVPESLSLLKTSLESLGAKKQLDEFVTSMNRSAEASIVKTIPIFTKALSNMSIDDSKKILMGKSDEATKYLKTKTEKSITEAIAPIIKESMAKSDVMTYYTAINSLYTSSKDAISSNAQIKSAMSLLTGDTDTTEYEDVESYVVAKTLNGVFLMVAQKEKEIRENPIFRTTDLLKDIFKLQD